MPACDLLLDLAAPASYYPCLRAIAGSVNAAILLSLLLRWTLLDCYQGGWVMASAERVQRATGLTRREQERARAQLVKVGLVGSELMGSPATTHLKVDSAAFTAAYRAIRNDSPDGGIRIGLYSSLNLLEEDQEQEPPYTPLSVHGEGAARVLAAYLAVKPASHDTSRRAAKEQIARLLRLGLADEAALTRAAAHYAEWCEAHGRDHQHRRNAQNFYRRDGEWSDFAAADWTLPAVGAGSTLSALVRRVARGDVDRCVRRGVTWRVFTQAHGDGLTLDVCDGHTPQLSVSSGDALAALGDDVEWRKGDPQ